VAIRYLLKIHPQVLSEDIPALPLQLRAEFSETFQRTLQADAHNCRGFPWHFLRGELTGYRALEIEWQGNPNTYRLVYRIYEKPAPRRVDEHDSAYNKAIARAGRR